jgi:hypothetical protein
MRMYVCVCMCVCVCMYVCMYVQTVRVKLLLSTPRELTGGAQLYLYLLLTLVLDGDKWFNIVNYIFLLLLLCIVIVTFRYFYCYVCSILCILFHCDVRVLFVCINVYCTVLYCSVLYCTVLYCTVLYYCHRV